ncbi:MAG TPA: hypothetical protein VH062_17645 [Polyangiaceae bacterium]|nr:hypothetical protein [Polyangiaceae bacterium]
MTRTQCRGALSAALFVVACQGNIDAPAGAGPNAAGAVGRGGASGSGVPGGGTSGTGLPGGGTGQGGGTTPGGAAGLDGSAPPSAPIVPFYPLSPAASVTKVKNLLTGLAPTQAELDAVAKDASALGGLVDGWMKLPAYTEKMEIFFADAFQQSQAAQTSFKTVIDDGTFSPNDGLLLNFRQSFAKTMTELVKEGHPFTEAATTTRYMMTTAMMTYYAYSDASLLTDATATNGGDMINRYYKADKNWSWSVTAKGNIPLADSGNPSSPNYLKFYAPDLPMMYGQYDGQTQDVADYCSHVDPVVMNAQTGFALGSNLAAWLYSFLKGENFWFFDPPQNQPNATWCQAGGGTTDSHNVTHQAALTDADYTDWRMVTLNPVSANDPETRFFDIAGNRASSTLNLYAQRVGYFTTPSFFAQYPTNLSNQARATINQTMIIGLGQAFDGSDLVTVSDAPGLAPEHASNGACFQCHWSLDPMKRFFRSNFTLNYSAQLDPAQIAIPGTFLFDEAVDHGSTMYDLGKQLSIHPKFKTAWTQKLCAWANSGPCLADDPELVRVAGVFASASYDWNALVRALFTSPLVTYTASTQTTQTNGAPVAIARRAQLCATLGNRLGLADVCGLKTLQVGSCATDCPPKGNNVPSISTNLPSDGYSRGAVSALYVNNPDPFYRSSVEQICALVADKVVDVMTGTSLYSSSDSATAIAGIVHGLMGLDATRDTDVIKVLTDHFTAAKGAGKSDTVALKSTFTLGCISPWVVSVGQ